MSAKSKPGILASLIVIVGLGGFGAWQFGIRPATMPPDVPTVGTTQGTIEADWGEPVGSKSFTVKLDGTSVTIVTSEYEKMGKRVKVEYDRQLMAKKVNVLE
jgi:hypothetical protein